MNEKEAVEYIKERIEYINKHLKNYEKIECITAIYEELEKELKSFETILQSLEQKDKEIKQLKKQIELMAEYMRENLMSPCEACNTYFTKLCIDDKSDCKKWIANKFEERAKQYFERKCKDE